MDKHRDYSEKIKKLFSLAAPENVLENLQKRKEKDSRSQLFAKQLFALYETDWEDSFFSRDPDLWDLANAYKCSMPCILIKDKDGDLIVSKNFSDWNSQDIAIVECIASAPYISFFTDLYEKIQKDEGVLFLSEGIVDSEEFREDLSAILEKSRILYDSRCDDKTKISYGWYKYVLPSSRYSDVIAKISFAKDQIDYKKRKMFYDSLLIAYLNDLFNLLINDTEIYGELEQEEIFRGMIPDVKSFAPLRKNLPEIKNSPGNILFFLQLHSSTIEIRDEKDDLWKNHMKWRELIDIWYRSLKEAKNQIFLRENPGDKNNRTDESFKLSEDDVTISIKNASSEDIAEKLAEVKAKLNIEAYCEALENGVSVDDLFI